MESRPLVSVIMPAFQAEEFLEDAIASILAQDYDPFEVVVCDDGSTDRTPEILAAHPELRTIRQSNAGAAAARNAAVAASQGELLAFFDADDLWPPTRLAAQAGFLVGHPEVGCVLGRQEWIDPPPWLARDAVYGDVDGIPLLSAMIRRRVFEAVGGFDESFTHSEDMDLLFRLRERGIRIEVIPEIILFRRFHGRNLTAAPPSTSPLLRSLRQKLERERAVGGGAA
ncbi:MAG TPA: glycosyltransferase family A protein [Gaiellaceae bacterium]|nr:glycosyltransferase family A protein [Gaiellaceae bacterium]